MRAPTDPLVTLDGGTLVVDLSLAPGDAELVEVGMSVALADDVGGWTGTAKVAAIGAPVAKEGEEAQVSVRLTPDAPLPSTLAGGSLRATISSATSGDAVLAVPVAAVTASADRSTYVIRVDDDGNQTKVVVRTGVSGDGFVEVTPVDGDLADGDSVVTGR